MGNYNEYQKGLPDLGNTYWQELNSSETQDAGSLNKIVELNCKTIFAPDDFRNVTIYKPSIFNNE